MIVIQNLKHVLLVGIFVVAQINAKDITTIMIVEARDVIIIVFTQQTTAAHPNATLANAQEGLAKHPHQRQHQLQLLYLPLHPAFQVLPNHVVVRVHLAVMDACVPMIHVVKMKTL
jgi:hypothetical protein